MTEEGIQVESELVVDPFQIPATDDSDEEEQEQELDTQEQVQEALHNIHTVSDVEISWRPCDLDEEKLVSQFCSTGCGCRRKCSCQFSLDHIRNYRSECFDLTRGHLDMAILGQLAAFVNTSDKVVVESRHSPKEREKAHTTFYHAGKIVCAKTYRFLHTIGNKRLKNLQNTLKENGLSFRTHGNTHRKPKHSLSFESTENVITFLLNYAVQHALLLPGRVPGYSRSDIKLLPSSVSKRGIWRVYHLAAVGKEGIHACAYSTFCRLWRTLLPSIIIMKPMTDLCWTCHQNSTAILRATNCSESDKSETIRQAEEHLRIVQVERSFYKTTCDECKESVMSHFTVDDQFQPPPMSSNIPANSNNIKVHYSFDYAQQVHIPADPLQPGPIYFLTPRKCAVFGVNCEAIPRQVNFLTDEAGECGKGANNVVSRLHYFLECHGLGEKKAFLHADNCSGQNKNNCMIQYLTWRALTKRHTSITLSFLVVGHTKFSPDWCFGLFKRRFRFRTKVGSLRSLAQVVDESAKCNFPQLV